MKSIYILGRQPEIGLAELESLLGAENIKPIGESSASSEQPTDHIPFSRLGGSIKACKVLTELPYTDWTKIEDYLVETAPKMLEYLPEGKLQLGISAYGLPVGVKRINASALTLKKAIRATGKSVRIIPNQKAELNTAQVLHNKLTGPSGWELVLIKNGSQTILAQTTEIQDIEAYTARDQKRPKRDARVGMLPPKLAQIILNLSGAIGFTTLLDPFCGTGVVLQEALLMDMDAYGTDLDARMVEYSLANLEWLDRLYGVKYGGAIDIVFSVQQGDATNAVWKHFDSIACETYLGRPFSAEPRSDVLNEVMRDVDTIHRKFLQNVSKQTQPGFKMCIAVPAWKTRYGFKHLKVLDSLEELGYTRQSFVHVGKPELIYHRPDQFVGRELVVLIRK